MSSYACVAARCAEVHAGRQKFSANRAGGVGKTLRVGPLVLGLVAFPPMAARAQPSWPDDRQSRLAVLALMQTLNADLLSHDSATLTLDRWCADHRLATPAQVVADRDSEAVLTATDEQRRRLQVEPGDIVRYRRVRLRCGTHVLSEADNFYVPGRLTPAMNRELETTDVAFGRAVESLRFSRHTLSARLLWDPLPAGWEMGTPVPDPGPGLLAIPSRVLEHQAVLTTPDGRPFSLVIERYTSEVLDFGPPPR